MAIAVPIWHGVVDKDGRPTLDVSESDHRRAYLRSLAGKRIEMTVRAERSKRSDKSNKYYWSVVLGIISEHTGYEPQELHEVLTMKFLRIDDDPLTGAPRRQHTPKTDTAEFAAYTDQVIRFAAVELGLYIPSSDEVAA